MREEEEGSWFARWEDELPTPEELMPLSQTLITPDLAIAFDIPTSASSNSHPSPPSLLNHLHQAPPPPPPPAHQHHHTPPPEYDSGDLGGGGPDEPARTLKRPRLVWTPQLHKRFVDAVAHLGIKNAVPKTIMQLMSVDGLTRENVASHLQKYRLYLKRMQGLSSSSGSGGGGGHISAADDQLFASGPVPHHFLNRGPGPEPFLPYVPAAALQHHQHMAAAAAAVQQQFYHQRQMGQFGSPTGTGHGFEHGFLNRSQPQPAIHRKPGTVGLGMIQPPPPPPQSSYTEDPDSGSDGTGKKVLTLFPTGKD